MPILTSPKTLNDGVADHIFTFRAQLPDLKYVVGQWFEAASPKSLMIFKHDDRGKVIRRLAQNVCQLPLVTDTTIYKPVTINVTATYDPDHAAAEVAKRLIIAKAMLTDSNFITNFLQGQV